MFFLIGSHHMHGRKKDEPCAPNTMAFVQDNLHMSILSMLKQRQLNTLKPGFLLVAAYADFFPVCYMRGKVISGLDVDILKAFGKAAGLKVSFIRVKDFDGIWHQPAQKFADVSIGGIANSAGRTHRMTEWTIPYFYVRRSLLFHLNNPVRQFPQDIHGIVLGTRGSTGWVDATIRAKADQKAHWVQPGGHDQEDIDRLLRGEVQGVVRGDFVSRAWVARYPQKLGLITWDAEASILPTDGEVFAYPCRKGSGVAMSLSVFLSHLIESQQIHRLLHRYKLVA
jgi:ABC-type amino acid transport substrate-binding protein